jgi:hypothetical protein
VGSLPAVAGCIEGLHPFSNQDDTGPSENEPETHPDESDSTGNDAIEDILDLGTWYRGNTYGVRVDDIETTTSFYDTIEETEKEMPEGMQLVSIDFIVKNLDSDNGLGPGVNQFAVIVDETIFEPVDVIEGVEGCRYDCSDSTDIDWWEKSDERDRITVGPQDIERGETRKFWFATVLEDTIQYDEITVGYDPGYDGQFTVRWTQ